MEPYFEKIKRPNFAMSIWKYAHLSSQPNTFDPEVNGWTLIDSNYYYCFVGDINFIPSEAYITEEGIIYLDTEE